MATQHTQVAMDIFDGVGGFTYTTNLDYEDPSSEVWMDTIQGWLAEGKPVMVCWNDWATGDHRQAPTPSRTTCSSWPTPTTPPTTVRTATAC